MHRLMVSVALSIAASAFAQAPPAPRPLTVADFASIRDVGEPQVSPDGAWVLYAVKQPDLADDKSHTHVWMSSWDGQQAVQLTFSKGSEKMPRWSPDGSSIAFLSSRATDDEIDQLWIMNRLGGEAEKVTAFEGSVVDYDWSPDGKRIAAAVEDADPLEPKAEDGAKSKEKKTKPPIVVNRYRFKQDIAGYLTTGRQHIYLLDLESRKSEILTPGRFSESLPSFSPDGKSIAFVSNRDDDPDRSVNNDIWIIDARSGATPRKLTTYAGNDADPEWESRPAWSPDGTRIAYLQGGPTSMSYYAIRHLAVIPAAGGPPAVITASIDRDVWQPQWSSDGASVSYIIEDDRTQRLERIGATGGSPQVVAAGPKTILAFDTAGGHTAMLVTDDLHPAEVFAVDGRQITRQNAGLLSTLRLATVTDTEFRSKDGANIHGFIVTPPGYESGRRYPAVLRIHGGPVSQFSHKFSLEWQLLAANGYVVIAANPRGSSGRGHSFSRVIWADWGNKDAQDVLAAVDDAVARGIADPARLGVGGWSYGGMLTNYVIAQDSRFKAATSGASVSNILAGYGTDEYVRDYEAELGKPWEHPEVYLHLSFPFLHADRIVTPTLFLAGESDFNVPLLNSEQMYQALRSLGRPTELVIYPGQYHGLTKPSYIKDRYERYLAWYAKYIK
jgi:dipeptidyl aminopeptidase/acylaminoacyl peptidase